MELTWYGRTCVRLRGRDAVVVADPYPSIVGPTGRGITGEIVTYSHPHDAPDTKEALAKFFHEMGGEPAVQPKLSITISQLPAETTTVLLESRGKV